MRKNRELALAVLAEIKNAEPGEWDQNFMVSCFAGRTLKRQGYTLRRVDTGLTPYHVCDDPAGNRVENILVEAAAELGFTKNEACAVFLYYPAPEMYDTGHAYEEIERRVHEALASENDTDFSDVI